MRDYYTREKKKTGDGRSGSAAKKRKKTPMYFDILTFLDVTKQSRWTESNVDFNESEGDTHNELEATTSTEQRSHTDTSKPCFRVKRPKTTLFQETLPKPMEESTTNVKSEADPNKQFLMSLLPEMHSMSERQNFEFRFQIMNILRNIKYKTTSHASNRPNSFDHNIMYQNLPPQTNAQQFRKTRSCVKPR